MLKNIVCVWLLLAVATSVVAQTAVSVNVDLDQKIGPYTPIYRVVIASRARKRVKSFLLQTTWNHDAYRLTHFGQDPFWSERRLPVMKMNRAASTLSLKGMSNGEAQ